MKNIFFVLVFGFFLLKAGVFENWNEQCDEGNMASCANLGYLYQSAQGVERNLAKAKFFYQKACGGGYQPACIAYESLKEEGHEASD